MANRAAAPNSASLSTPATWRANMTTRDDTPSRSASECRKREYPSSSSPAITTRADLHMRQRGNQAVEALLPVDSTECQHDRSAGDGRHNVPGDNLPTAGGGVVDAVRHDGHRRQRPSERLEMLSLDARRGNGSLQLSRCWRARSVQSRRPSPIGSCGGSVRARACPGARRHRVRPRRARGARSSPGRPEIHCMDMDKVEARGRLGREPAPSVATSRVGAERDLGNR